MTRRERLERKLEKRQEWGEKAATRSATGFDAAWKSLQQIPPGQPILIGHHSEKRHRAHLDRVDGQMARAHEQAEKAKHHAQAASGLADQLESSTYSDDPDAIEQLQARIAEIEKECDWMKQANAAYRKAKGAPGWATGLGLDEPKRLALEARGPFQPYTTTNRRANARRLAQRIKDITARNARTAKAQAAGGVVVEGSAEYVRVTFAERPTWSVIESLKAAGFHWSGGGWCGYRAKIPAGIGDGAGTATSTGRVLEKAETGGTAESQRVPDDQDGSGRASQEGSTPSVAV